MRLQKFWRSIVCSVILGGFWSMVSVVGAAPLPPDDFDNGVLDPGLWSVNFGQVVESGTVAAVGGGASGGGQFSSTSSVLYERLTFRLNDFYESRSVADYTAYSIGFAGYIGSEWILVRTDNTGGAHVKIEVNTPNDGNGAGGVPFTSISIADNSFHDLIIDIQWSSTQLLVEIDDLNNGIGVDVSAATSDTNLIPSTAMQFTAVGQGADPNYQPYNVDWVNAIPEPASMAIWGLGGLAMMRRRR